jgi:hypothetical protein
VQTHLAGALAPDQPDRQRPLELAAGGLVADPAVEPGPQDMQFGFLW